MTVYSELVSSTYRPKNKWFETRLFGNSRFDFTLKRRPEQYCPSLLTSPYCRSLLMHRRGLEADTGRPLTAAPQWRPHPTTLLSQRYSIHSYSILLASEQQWHEGNFSSAFWAEMSWNYDNCIAQVKRVVKVKIRIEHCCCCNGEAVQDLYRYLVPRNHLNI